MVSFQLAVYLMQGSVLTARRGSACCTLRLIQSHISANNSNNKKIYIKTRREYTLAWWKPAEFASWCRSVPMEKSEWTNITPAKGLVYDTHKIRFRSIAQSPSLGTPILLRFLIDNVRYQPESNEEAKDHSRQSLKLSTLLTDTPIAETMVIQVGKTLSAKSLQSSWSATTRQCTIDMTRERVEELDPLSSSLLVSWNM